MPKNPPKVAKIEYALGVDLGTTYSCVSIFRRGQPETINVLGENMPTTPSWVLFKEGRVKHTGRRAKLDSPFNTGNTVFNSKRIIGRKFSEPEVQEEVRRMPFRIIDDKGFPRVEISEEGTVIQVSPDDVSSAILKTLKKSANTFLSIPDTHDTKAVITVPASFTDAQRQATKLAAQKAGLEVLQLMNEPTAAAVAYGFHLDKPQKLLVFDFGGGTLDVTILRIEQNHVFTTLATACDMYFGGEDFDHLLVDMIVKRFNAQHKVDLRKPMCAGAIALIRVEAAKAKEQLSTDLETELNVRCVYGNQNLDGIITREEFENAAAGLFSKVLRPVKAALAQAKLKVKDINEVVLVGGSSRIPKVQEILAGFFHGKTLRKDINADQAVSYGAAIQAYDLLQRGENGGLGLVTLREKNSLSLGIGTFEHKVLVFMPRNTQIPARKEQIMYTSEDNQTYMEFPVYEGEHVHETQNNLLGTFSIRGLPPLPKAQLQFDVVFNIDQSGLLHVTASNRRTGKFADIHITDRDTDIQKWMK